MDTRYQSGTLVIIDEPTLSPKFVCDIRFLLYILWVWTDVCDISIIMASYQIISLPWKPSVLACSLYLPPGITGGLTLSIALPFPESYSWNHVVCSLSQWLLSLSCMHLRCRHAISRFDSWFHFALNIPLYGYISICPSPHEGYLGCFHIWALILRAQVFVWISFHASIWWQDSMERGFSFVK